MNVNVPNARTPAQDRRYFLDLVAAEVEAGRYADAHDMITAEQIRALGRTQRWWLAALRLSAELDAASRGVGSPLMVADRLAEARRAAR